MKMSTRFWLATWMAAFLFSTIHLFGFDFTFEIERKCVFCFMSFLVFVTTVSIGLLLFVFEGVPQFNKWLDKQD